MTIPCRHTGYTANKLIDEANQEKEPFDAYEVLADVPEALAIDELADMMVPPPGKESEQLLRLIRSGLFAEKKDLPDLLALSHIDIGKMVMGLARDYAYRVWEEA